METPNAKSTPEQLAAIEKCWAETWYGEEKGEGTEIHDSPWLGRCIDKATGGKTNLRWFVPLCEKSPAMKWLADQGHEVIGVELVGKAIEMFFNNHGIKFTKSDIPEMEFGCLYQSEDKRIQIFKCSMFHVTRDLIGGPIDAVWERGSLQSIDAEDRQTYGEIVLSLLKPDGRILAETFEDVTMSSQSSSNGNARGDDEPRSHSISAVDFERLFGERCKIEVLAEEHWGAKCEVVDDKEPYSYINTVRIVTFK